MAEAAAPAQNAQATPNPVADPKQPAGAAPTPGADKGTATKDAAQEAMRKFKVKVDNQEVEVDEAELLKGYTHAKAAAKRFQEGSRARAQAEQLLTMLKDKNKLFEVLQKLGHDPLALAEEKMAAHVKRELMDPKDRQLSDYEQKIKDFEEAEARRKEEAKQKEHDKLKAKYAKDFESAFMDALKTSGLPQTKAMVGEMAKYIKRAADIGYQISPQDAAKLVREDEETRIQSIAGETEAETLARLLGEKTLEKLRAWEAQKVKDPNAQLRTPTMQEQTGERRQKSDTKRMTPQEWRKFNRGF